MPVIPSTIILDDATRKNVDLWLHGDYDAETKAQIQEMLKLHPQEVVDAFYTQLTFGTGGLRGLMGIGSNRMNIYTVRAAAQGLAQYVLMHAKPLQKQSILIGYDSRRYSKEFAEESAKVLAGNGIHVFLFSNIRPTPLISFGCRYKKCSAAIMITASHNPPNYNGFKIYWSDGGQVVSPHDAGILAEISKIIEPSKVKTVASIQDSSIELIGDEIDDAYSKAIKPLQNFPKENKNFGHTLKWVYTSLHGTGITIVPKITEQWGFSKPILVERQVIPDSEFSTAPYPNPEEPEALRMGVELMEAKQADLLIATDPDADRLGVVVRHRGQSIYLSGNNVACICLEHICKAMSDQKRLPVKVTFIKTIVTSELFRAIAESYQRKCLDTLIGFKYIAQQIVNWEEHPEGPQFLFGAEESLGYLLGTHAHDKDAVVSSALICEIALHAKLKGKTLIDLLHDLYMKYGVYIDKVWSIKFSETKESKDNMAAAMTRLRQFLPTDILGIKVIKTDNYPANILTLWLEDGSKITVRPSGTEPKIKLYCGAIERDFKSLSEAIACCSERVESLLRAVEKLVRE